MKSHFFNIVAWTGAVVAALLPGLVALDSGGVFPWTFWLVAMIAWVPFVCGACTAFVDEQATTWRPLLLSLAGLVLAAYAWLQVVPLPAGIAGTLSPGSAAAWTEWMPAEAAQYQPLGDASAFPFSVAPALTRHYIGYFVLLAVFSWAGATLFHDRGRIAFLLSAFAIAGAVHSLLGLWQVFLFPDRTVWNVMAGSPFGVFVNRNNSALLLNLSLASSLGLVAWRLSAVTGHEFGGREFKLAALLDVFSDRPAMIAMICGGINCAGLLACGSRGGMAGAIVGFALAMGVFAGRSVTKVVASGACVVVLLVLVLFARADVTPRTLERFGASAQGISDSILADERLPHWSDALTAVKHYLPAGAGFGTYRFAYLPYENIGTDGWFVNADNLWLEWTLEGGVVAVIAMLMTLGIVIVSLLRLRGTADPLDHGVSITGWFCLGAVVVSQSFDFGLLHVGSATAVALLLGVVLARSAREGVSLIQRDRAAGDRITFKSTGRHYLPGAVTVSLMTAGLLAASAFFEQEARLDSLTRDLDVAVSLGRSESILRRVNEFNHFAGEDNEQPQVDYILALAHLELSRSVVESELEQLSVAPMLHDQKHLGSLTQLRELITLLRLASDTNDGGTTELQELTSKLIELGQSQRELARKQLLQALADCPLWPEPRILLAQTQLDFPISEENKELLEEVVKLRRASTISLETVAQIWDQAGQHENSVPYWRRLIELNPFRVRQYLKEMEQRGNPYAMEVLPNDREVLINALEYELAKPVSSEPLVRSVVAQLVDDLPQSKFAVAEHHELIGRAYMTLNRPEEAIAEFAAATEIVPNKLKHRVAQIRALESIGRVHEALRLAREAQPLVGIDDTSFASLYKRLEKSVARESKNAFSTETPFSDLKP